MEFSAGSGLSRLHDVITRIHADPDLDSVLQAIVDGVVEVSGFRASVINVYWPESDEFELVAVARRPPRGRPAPAPALPGAGDHGAQPAG